MYKTTYDEFGNKTEFRSGSSYDDDRGEKITTWKYQYDKHNNWIDKKEYKNGEFVKQQIRTIKYYN